MTAEEVDMLIDQMKAQLGVELDRELADKLQISPTAVAGWRSRSRVPAKYVLRFSRRRDERVGGLDHGNYYSRLREAYVFCLVEAVSKRLDASLVNIAPNDFFEMWRGYRLADAYSYFLDKLSPEGDRDALRREFEEARGEVATTEFLEWLEGLG